MTRLFVPLALGLAFAVPAQAQTAVSGDALRAALVGSTVTGGMADGSAYAEFYAEDGTIRARDYTGVWTIEGDQMCLNYGGAPSCFGAAVDGSNVTWLVDGTVAGTGTIAAGNSNGF